MILPISENAFAYNRNQATPQTADCEKGKVSSNFGCQNTDSEIKDNQNPDPLRSRTDLKVPANAVEDISNSAMSLTDQNIITPQADNSKNKACGNPPPQNKGKGPPVCVGHLVVIKHVINDNGGTSTAEDFTIDVSRPLTGAESPGTDVALSPGPFSVSEIGPTGYTQSLSGDCSGTINAGDNKVCTITNNDNPQTGGPSISVTSVNCGGTEFTGEPILVVHIIFSGIPHDSQYLPFKLQYYLPTGNLLETSSFTIPATAPDPWNAESDVGLRVPPGPTAGTYKIIMVINYDYDNPVTTTFQAPECFNG